MGIWMSIYKTMNKFSICIPNFNYAKHIGETIQSVLNQTYQNYEIIVVDNASTDNSWNIIEEFQKKDKRIRIYKNEYNVGFAPNLDMAVSKAKNNFILVLSSDDTMNENALNTYNQILEAIEKKDKERVLICSSVNIIDGNSKKYDFWDRTVFHKVNHMDYKHLDKFKNIYMYNGIEILKYIFKRFSVPGPFMSTLFSKSIYAKVGGYSSINLIGPDAHFSYKCLFKGFNLIYCDIPLFNYRIHMGGQLNLTKKNKNINVLIDRYIFSNYYSDDQLIKIGISRKDYIKSIIDTYCIKSIITSLSNFDFIFSLRQLSFTLAAYPNDIFKNLKIYPLILLLISAPLSMPVLSFLKFIKKNI